MARNDPQVNIRLPVKMKEGLERAAAVNQRAFKAEIVARLEEYEANSGILEVAKGGADKLREENARLVGELEALRQVVETTNKTNAALEADIRKLARMFEGLRSDITIDRAMSIRFFAEEDKVLKEAVASNEILAALADGNEIADLEIKQFLERAFSHPAGTERIETMEHVIQRIKARRAIDRGLAEATTILEPLLLHIASKRRSRKARK